MNCVDKLARMQRAVLDHNLPHGAVSLMVLLETKYVNGQSGNAWPSRQTLADDLGVCWRSVVYWMKMLIEGGYYEKTLRSGKTNVYKHPPRPVQEASPVQEDASIPVQTSAPEGGEGCKTVHGPVQNDAPEPLEKNLLNKEGETRASAREPALLIKVRPARGGDYGGQGRNETRGSVSAQKGWFLEQLARINAGKPAEINAGFCC